MIGSLHIVAHEMISAFLTAVSKLSVADTLLLPCAIEIAFS